MKLAILLFDGFTALDIVGGYEVLARLPGMETVFIAETLGIVAADTRRLGMVAYQSFEDAADADILYVPGGPGVVSAMESPQLLAYLQRVHRSAKWTLGICNGVALLGKAGLLQNRTVTTNWGWRERVAAFGATVVTSRYHADGSLVTGAGVSASIDAGLFLAGKIAGEGIAQTLQLGIEYYPQPPFGGTTPDEAPDAIKAIIKTIESAPESVASLQTPPPFATGVGSVLAAPSG